MGILQKATETIGRESRVQATTARERLRGLLHREDVIRIVHLVRLFVLGEIEKPASR